MFLLAEPSLSLRNRAEGGGSEWESRLSAEQTMLSTGLHFTSESTDPMARRKAPKIPDAILDQLLGGADPKTAFDPNGLLGSLDYAVSLDGSPPSSGAAVKNLAHNAFFDSALKGAP